MKTNLILWWGKKLNLKTGPETIITAYMHIEENKPMF